ncbi:fumarylacetoacetate hydrolase family protein [Microbacterium sp. AK031]|uniref:fumarylacetoacetate hydrolase family protein n=1 Tax=Microbacterium sp. AK031 TaxID=2723076 RepID=UPI00216941D0|nr:fumarylacetoacetate hydrolase family protein [Microbacterium sp. AK031]MCS3844037.1 2-keto-4-pentenoate hydratase/2-oxohepta-3-ene-1,7-dioic acid hydratase in catechol pathway [Microbacterium sp. AK031]
MRYAQTMVDGFPYIVASDEAGSWRRSDTPGELFALIAQGKDALLIETDRLLHVGAHLDEGEVAIGASFGTPPTVRDFYAFEDHVKAGRHSRGLDMDPLWYGQPVFYFSNPYAVSGAGDVRATPRSAEFDFEMEVAAVLWGGGANLAPSSAEELIAGYCIMNDWSGRDVQREEMRMSMGPVKGKDTTTSLGPILVTSDELEDARRGNGFDLTMRVSVNGTELSVSNLDDIHWSFGEMISYASRGTEVRAGDVIGSGTANGGCLLELRARAGGSAIDWLRPGDEVEISVDRLGTLCNTVRAAESVIPLL